MILLIDTSQETATVALFKGGSILFSEENKIAKEHATWLHMAVKRLLEKAGISIGELEAVSIISGPGSYTGLRVGLSAAKGICYGLKIPLITQNTLKVMAESMKSVAEEKNALICPLIDARRDEVFTAIYNISMEELLPPGAMILDKNAFESFLLKHNIIFCGSGAFKWQKINTSSKAIFEPQKDINQAFGLYSQVDFIKKNWADPVYSEPVYLKEFFSY